MDPHPVVAANRPPGRTSMRGVGAMPAKHRFVVKQVASQHLCSVCEARLISLGGGDKMPYVERRHTDQAAEN